MSNYSIAGNEAGRRGIEEDSRQKRARRAQTMHLNPRHILIIAVVGWMNREQSAVVDYLKEENRILREWLGNKRPRLNNDQRRRLAALGKALGRKLLSTCCSIVTPDTVLRWHRKLIAMKYDGSASRGPGRPRIGGRIRGLAVRMAQENPGWGYTMIRGALFNLGHTVARETVRISLKERGIEPAPERRKRMPWSTFLKSHWNSMAAADLFTVEIWSSFGLVRYYVLYFIRLSTRRVHFAGIAAQPHAGWIKQIARKVTDPMDGFLAGIRYLITDRDAIFTKEFRSFLKREGVKAVRLPARSPSLNAYAERFVRTIKETCPDRMILFDEGSLHRAINEFVRYYHHERNHQGLGNRLIDPREQIGATHGLVKCRGSLGGLLRYCYRQAA